VTKTACVLLVGVMNLMNVNADDVVTIKSAAGGEVKIAKHGAKILSWIPRGGAEVFFVPASHAIEGEAWQHGGVPVCWPWFSGNHAPGLPNHGFARFCRFTLKGVTETNGATTAVFTLASSPETKRLWPHDFELEYAVTLSDRLTATLTTRNTGAEAFTVLEGLHPYFRLAERAKACVRGADGAPYCDTLSQPRETFNERDGFTRVWTGGDVTLEVPHDHVFRPAKVRYDVVDPVEGRKVHVDATGCSKLIVWCPDKAGHLGNLTADEVDRFVCAEPADVFGDACRKVPAGGSLVLTAVFSVSK